jgi:hypothetical protein
MQNLFQVNAGKFFSVVYFKKDGSITKRIGRCGVKKYLSNKSHATRTMSDEIITYYDLGEKAYRSFRKDRLVAATMMGNYVNFVDNLTVSHF